MSISVRFRGRLIFGDGDIVSTNPITELLTQVKFPRLGAKKPGELSYQDYLIMLLTLGAQIEHSLMVQYLYAAYSLRPEKTVPGVSEAMIQHWQREILTIAREEMGHLISVQNVLTLLGGPISLNREDFPWDVPFYPFPFKLEPLTYDSLSRYVYAEKPPREQMQGVGPNILRIYDNVCQYIAEVYPLSHPVAELYQLILSIISDLGVQTGAHKRPPLIPDSAFDAKTYAVQASWDEWAKGYRIAPENTPAQSGHKERGATVIVEKLANRTQAIQALKAIANQGENPYLFGRGKSWQEQTAAPIGAGDDWGDDGAEPGHFRRFVEIYKAWEKVGFPDIASDVARNPTTFQPNELGPAAVAYSSMTYEPSRLWGELFNIRYRLLLAYLSWSFTLARASDPAQPNTHGNLVHRIFGEMYNLKTIAGILVRMPLTSPDRPERAGPPFQMPYTLDLPIGGNAVWKTYKDMLGTSLLIGGKILRGKRGDCPEQGQRYLAVLQDLDRNAIAWIDRTLAGTNGI